MNKYILTALSPIIPITILSNSASAQSILDAGKYGQTASFSTARSVGFGGALGSVGGDFGSVSVNPAGLGIYRSSEFMLTPGLRFSSADSKYTGSSIADNNVRFGFNNVGAVFTEAASGKNYDKADWKSGSFAIGINRTADFSRTYNYEGSTNSSSASQYFEGDAYNFPNSTSNDPGTPAYLGYQSYLLGDFPYYTMVPYSAGINQKKTVQEKGGITELAISGGGNYRDKLMIGGTLGINFLNHRVNTSMYEETIDPAVSDSFDHFNYDERFKTNGAGVNLKLGAIYKFNDYFRAGLAFHTPTIYGLTEISSNNISVTSAALGTTTKETPENQYEYSYISPFKTIASVTGILGKYGFISLDYEMVSYSTMRFNMDDKVTQNRLNGILKNTYGNASNIRAGLELRFDGFMVRGGYGFYGSPYKSETYQGTRNDYSFGLGYRFGQTFVDLGIINSRYTSKEQPYVLDGSLGYSQPAFASIKNSLTTGVLTVGWKL
jgi:hypothetical protein